MGRCVSRATQAEKRGYGRRLWRLWQEAGLAGWPRPGQGMQQSSGRCASAATARTARMWAKVLESQGGPGCGRKQRSGGKGRQAAGFAGWPRPGKGRQQSSGRCASAATAHTARMWAKVLESQGAVPRGALGASGSHKVGCTGVKERTLGMGLCEWEIADPLCPAVALNESLYNWPLPCI